MGSAADIDLLIVGSGVAGLSAATRALAGEPGIRVAVLTRTEVAESATAWAQGGVAAVLSDGEVDRSGVDSPDLHAADTLRAGAGLCDRAAVEMLVRDGPDRVRALARLGAVFDRSATGRWELAREGGHSTARVVHAGGAATGAEVERALVGAVRAGAARLEEHVRVADLIVEGGRCRGVVTADGTEVRADHTVLATGGAGQLYSVTTNPPAATGSGLAMALRAGVAVADVEFVQFHPTALFDPAGDGPRLLLSEALRGEGALLRDAAGRRFVDEMQPRDVVAAAVAAAGRESGLGHAWLDVSDVEDFGRRFSSLSRSVRALGLDPGRDWLPVAPAAHYLCGGVLTDLDGATTLPGLWAAGEVACTGVHGANRLASNSLVEGMVFATRAVDAILGKKGGPHATGVLLPVLDPGARAGIAALPLPPSLPRRGTAEEADPTKARHAIQRAMTDGAGVVRDEESLASAAAELDLVAASGDAADLLVVARAVVAAATARRESRGGHRRRDYPGTDPALSRRFVQW
ncbi:MAG TPA: FAD-dependent oxidoreductase [Acidimicrobiales bacterium]|nr:FAD-dependent oxidoreductase [Acidimicrobiales bacterium]